MLRESAEIVRMEHGVIISRTRHGYVCANAGVDASNVGDGDVVTLLPEDADRSAAGLRQAILAELGVDVGGRGQRFLRPSLAPGHHRRGPGRVRLRAARRPARQADTEGREMRATVVAVADQLASTAELASGKTSRRPLVLIRGAMLPAGSGSVVEDVVMPPEQDLFR